MPFNSQTYHMNKRRREAWENLARARDIKERAARGEAYSWEPPRVAFFVRMARLSMKMHLSHRRLRELERR